MTIEANSEGENMLLADLRTQLASPGAVLCVMGAGVTRSALSAEARTRASWQGLLTHGLARVVALRQTGVTNSWGKIVTDLISSGDAEFMTFAAQAIVRKLDRSELRRWLADAVGTLAAVPTEDAVLRAAAILCRAGALIGTTNYDDLLSKATNLQPVTWRSTADFISALQGRSPAVLHFHGHWRDTESVVLGASSYEDVLRDPAAQAALRAAATMKSFLFVGYGAGLDDPNFGGLIKWMGQVLPDAPQRHFRLVLESELPESRPLNEVRAGIFRIPYGKAHIDLGPFLESLLPPERRQQLGPDPIASEPRLDIRYDPESGWIVKNIGTAAAIEVVVAQQLVGGSSPGRWFNPVSIPNLGAGEEHVAVFLDHVNDTSLGVVYKDVGNREYTTRCSRDRSKRYKGRFLPIWPDGVIGAHWSQATEMSYLNDEGDPLCPCGSVAEGRLFPTDAD